MFLRFLFIFLLLGTTSRILFAQPNKVAPIPPVNPREADVMFSKRVWRVIDLREKQNTIITWPKSDIRKALYQAALSQQLKPYKSDSLQSVYDIETFSNRGSKKILVKKLVDPNESDGLYITDTVYDPFIPEDRIEQLLLMEEMYYDKKMSREVIRIIAIAPLFNWEIEGFELGMQPICWLKYYDKEQKEATCRNVLLKQILFNPNNSRSTFSMDDWFEQRRFGSFIVKVSNMHDYSIMDDPEVKRIGLQALIAAEKQKQDLHERDMNNYED